ncbi:MAG: hypothetical protein AB7P20_11400 [Rhizobiaceae bacterium]
MANWNGVIQQMRKTVTFRKPVLMPSLGFELPAGSYTVDVIHHQVMLHARDAGFDEVRFHVPADVPKKGDRAAVALLRPGEFEKALLDANS